VRPEGRKYGTSFERRISCLLFILGNFICMFRDRCAALVYFYCRIFSDLRIGGPRWRPPRKTTWNRCGAKEKKRKTMKKNVSVKSLQGCWDDHNDWIKRIYTVIASADEFASDERVR